MCNVTPVSFTLYSDTFDEEQGEVVILQCPVQVCQYYKAWTRHVTIQEVHEAIIEHQSEGIW